MPHFEANKFINVSQIGGIDRYTLDDGAGRGGRALCVNTGAGLRYRVLPDRGLDIDQAFFNQHSLSFLTHRGSVAASQGLARGLDWLKGFAGGLLTSCGPTNIGPPGQDGDEELGLHGPHSNSVASIETLHQPDVRAKRPAMWITGIIRYGALYGPNLELHRTIESPLGTNAIDVIDEFRNVGNQPTPHAWLLHINFGYPLVDDGAELCFDSPRIEPTDAPASIARFKPGVDFKRIPGPLESHRGSASAVAYLFPRGADKTGRATVGIVNRKLGLGAAIRYNTRQFPRCGNWQHFGPGEYVTALEPMNGTIEGRWKDREDNLLDIMQPGDVRRYRYRIEIVSDFTGIDALRAMNG
jgi:hypothetical protein